MTRHKNADVTIAFVEGKRIQYRIDPTFTWVEYVGDIRFSPLTCTSNVEWRIALLEPEYQWKLTYKDANGECKMTAYYYKTIEEFKQKTRLCSLENIEKFEPSKKPV